MVGAALWAAARAWQKKFARPNEPRPKFKNYWLFATMGYATHCFVDSITSYGTVLFWPFSNTRVALDWVAIVDPFVTVPLLLGLWIGLRKKSMNPIIFFAALSFAYLGFMAHWHTRTEMLYKAYLHDNNVFAEHIRVTPLWFKPFVYRAVYKTPGQIHIANIRNGFSGRFTVENAGNIKKLDVEQFSRDYPALAKSIEGYDWFTDGFTGIYAATPLILGDYRYGYYITPLSPLWGLKVDMETNKVTPLSLRYSNMQ